jgi:uncharacterized protein YkwD
MNWLDIIHAWFGGKPKPKPKPGPPVNPPAATDLIVALNLERGKFGLVSLRESPALNASALAWAKSMATQGVLSHGDFAKRVSAVVPGHAAGEDIAEGQTTVAQVVASWMASPGHRANILGPYTQVGHGEATDSRGNRYWCVDFAS